MFPSCSLVAKFSDWLQMGVTSPPNGSPNDGLPQNSAVCEFRADHSCPDEPAATWSEDRNRAPAEALQGGTTNGSAPTGDGPSGMNTRW
jgi:hypothetical protein